MTSLFNELDSWLTSLILAACMFATWRTGWARGRNMRERSPEAQTSKFTDACLALLGLLLAFTFSMSLGRHDERRKMVVTDSNSIGDFTTCVAMLKEPYRGKLQAEAKTYVEFRLKYVGSRISPEEKEDRLREIQVMQNHMQSVVSEAVDVGTPIAVSLVNTFNELTSSHASRLAAERNLLPPGMVLVLFVTAMLSMLLLGTDQGMTKKRDHLATWAFIALVCLVVWVILDLNQPHRGMIVVSQEPLERLLRGMQ